MSKEFEGCGDYIVTGTLTDDEIAQLSRGISVAEWSRPDKLEGLKIIVDRTRRLLEAGERLAKAVDIYTTEQDRPTFRALEAALCAYCEEASK